jgi:hypothetical protein
MGDAMRLVLALATMVAAPLALAAQQTTLRMSPPQGQVSTYRIEVGTAIDMMAGSMDASSLLLMTATVTAASGSEHTIRTVIDSFSVNAPGMPMGAMPDLKGTYTDIRMTTRGEVLETTYSDPALTEQFGGMTDPQGFAAGLKFPEQAVAPGHTWSDTSVVETDAGGMGPATVTRVTNYTFERVFERGGARIAIIGFNGTVSQAAAMMTSEGPFTGSMEIDLTAGRWVTNRMEMTMEMDAGGQAASMTVRTTGRLVD